MADIEFKVNFYKWPMPPMQRKEVVVLYYDTYGEFPESISYLHDVDGWQVYYCIGETTRGKVGTRQIELPLLMAYTSKIFAD